MSDRATIDAYWERPETISLLDKNLRALETGFVLEHLRPDDELADFGCGDGESTVHYAAKVKATLALEHSNNLRGKAEKRFAEADVQNVTLVAGDALDLGMYEGQFDVAVTQRVVINFMTWEQQQQVIENVWKTLRPGGRYLMVENTVEGFEALNSVRRDVDLPDIPLHDWHNCFLHRDEFLAFIDDKFVVESTRTFDLYYLLTRVFVNMFASFEGYGAGAVHDDVFDVADAAAKRLYETLGDRIRITVPEGESFGPIQGFVLRRID
jgi:ubiquinone/menaquinone biosynthesis C-methylase UbiE